MSDQTTFYAMGPAATAQLTERIRTHAKETGAFFIEAPCDRDDQNENDPS